MVVGGPCVFNPEPLADVIDFAILGEGEEALPEVLTCYRNWKRKENREAGRNFCTG